MKAQEVYYQKIFEVSRFIFEHIGIRVKVDEGNNAKDIQAWAKNWVQFQNMKLKSGQPSGFDPQVYFITSVYYQRNFEIAKFIYEPMGIWVTVEDGDNAGEALKNAKLWVEQQHVALNPQLYPKKNVPIPDEGYGNHNDHKEPEVLPVIQVEKHEGIIIDLKIINQYQKALNNNDRETLETIALAYPDITSLGLKPASKLKTKTKTKTDA